MDYYTVRIGNLKRDLPIVAISPKIKIASFNLLGDGEMIKILAKKMASKLKNKDFDYLVGPEVKVVPFLQELSRLLKKPKYIVCRKEIHGYMVSPVVSTSKQRLVLDGRDAMVLKGKKVAVIDDVISSGKTINTVRELMQKVGAEVVLYAAIFKQRRTDEEGVDNVIFLGELPLIETS